MILNILVKYMNKDKIEKIVIVLVFIVITAIGSYLNFEKENKESNTTNSPIVSYELSHIPEYKNEIFVIINNNIPMFSDDDINIENDYYSDLIDGMVRNGYGKD